MKCPNPYCGDTVVETINEMGNGTRYCMGGCGFEETFKAGPQRRAKKRQPPPTPPIRNRGKGKNKPKDW